MSSSDVACPTREINITNGFFKGPALNVENSSANHLWLSAHGYTVVITGSLSFDEQIAAANSFTAGLIPPATTTTTSRPANASGINSVPDPSRFANRLRHCRVK